MTKRAKRLILSAFGLIAVIAITTGVLIFVLGGTRSEHPDPVSSSPDEVTAYYAKQSSAFWSDFDSLDPGALPVGIVYENGNLRFDIEAQSHVFFQARGNPKNFDEVRHETSSVVSDLGFKTVKDQETSVLYANENKLCQLQQRKTDKPTYSFACLYTETVNTHVALITQLLELYGREDANSSAKVKNTIIQLRPVEANERITYATISFSGEKSSTEQGYPRLLFGSVDGTWEYVANLNNTTVVNDGKRAVSEADLLRMYDDKWEGVLSNVF
jgi:hypothetical protein